MDWLTISFMLTLAVLAAWGIAAFEWLENRAERRQRLQRLWARARPVRRSRSGDQRAA